MGAFRSKLNLTLGLLQTQVDLQTVAETRQSPFHRICAEHATRIKLKNWCPEGEHEVTNFNLSIDTPEGLRALQPSERPTFTADDTLDFKVVPAADVEANTVPGPGLYYAKPSTMSGTSAQVWELLRRAANPKVAFVTKAALRQGEQKLWRLTIYRDYLALQELKYPDDIKAIPEVVHVTVPAGYVKQVKQAVDSMMTTWDKFDSTDPNTTRLSEWITTGTIVTPPTPQAANPVTQIGDLQAALVAMTRKKAS